MKYENGVLTLVGLRLLGSLKKNNNPMPRNWQPKLLKYLDHKKKSISFWEKRHAVRWKESKEEFIEAQIIANELVGWV